MNCNPMETCPENRPVFVISQGGVICNVERKNDLLFYANDSPTNVKGVYAGNVKAHVGWKPDLSWQTGPTPRIEGWFLVTWENGMEERVRWIATEGRWWNQYNRVIPETWNAWTWDLPAFVPPTKAAESTKELDCKSVDDIVAEIKRLTDYLATLVTPDDF